MKSFIVAALGMAILLSGCSTKNRYEREADKITNAVIADNMGPVFNDFDSSAQPTIRRVAVARLADELNSQGKFLGVQEVQVQNEGPTTHTFNAKFEKHMYTETMILDDDGKVREWHIHMQYAPAPSPTP
jgi:PBP1b-binding outer membrane lipoprotein LpoB